MTNCITKVGQGNFYENKLRTVYGACNSQRYAKLVIGLLRALAVLYDILGHQQTRSRSSMGQPFPFLDALTLWPCLLFCPHYLQAVTLHLGRQFARHGGSVPSFPST